MPCVAPADCLPFTRFCSHASDAYRCIFQMIFFHLTMCTVLCPNTQSLSFMLALEVQCSLSLKLLWRSLCSPRKDLYLSYLENRQLGSISHLSLIQVFSDRTRYSLLPVHVLQRETITLPPL